MEIIVVAQNKGGEGKTTTCQILASYFADIKGQNVLLIDTDSQCSLSNRYIAMEEDEYKSPDWDSTWIPPVHPQWEDGCGFDQRTCFADIYEGKPAAPYPTENERIDLIPGWSSRLDHVERFSRAEIKDRILDQPRHFFQDPGLEYYDKIIIDTPPKKNALTIGAIRAADFVVIPIKMERMSIEGLVGMFTLTYQQNSRRPKGKEVVIAGVLPNIVDNHARDHKQIYEKLLETESIAPFVIKDYLPQRMGIRDLSSTPPRGNSPFVLKKSDPTYKACLTTCQAIEERMVKS